MLLENEAFRFQQLKNFKQLAFDLICDLDIIIWNLFGPILRSGGACDFLFPVYPA